MILHNVTIQNVGPFGKVSLDTGPGLNMLTGPNGTGKTLLLDAAWRALTGTWARGPFNPRHRETGYHEDRSSIWYDFESRFESNRHGMRIGYRNWVWTKEARIDTKCLVIYVQDGARFMTWDPRHVGDEAVRFGPDDVFYGVTVNGVKRCNGLLEDWVMWQIEDGKRFERLKRALKALSPGPNDILEPGPYTRVLGDARWHPTVKTVTGSYEPVIYASAAIQRVLAMAYLMVWTRYEHIAASELMGVHPVNDTVLLVDNPASGLHPKWARRIVPGLLDRHSTMMGSHSVEAQTIVATQSPFVPMSVESRYPLTTPGYDRLYNLRHVNGAVELRDVGCSRRGDITCWLGSDAFGMRYARSEQAESIIARASELMMSSDSDPDEVRAVDKWLGQTLPPMDQFFIRWRLYTNDILK